MSPEHASLAPNEVTLVLGHMPATLVLHQFLNAPEMRQATLASLLGKAARRSVRVNGSDIPIPTYLRLVSHLCREVAEQGETCSTAAPPRARGEEEFPIRVAPEGLTRDAGVSKNQDSDKNPMCSGNGIRPSGGTVNVISRQRFSLQNYFGNHERSFPFTPNHIGSTQLGSCIVEGTADSSQFTVPVCLRVFVRDSMNQQIGPTRGAIFPGVATATSSTFSVFINNIGGSASAPRVYFQIDRLDAPETPGFRDPYLALTVDIKDWRP
jgi:hypothetical protein